MRRALLASVSLGLILGGSVGCKRKQLEAELAKVNAELDRTEAELQRERDKTRDLAARNQSFEARVTELEGELAQLAKQIEDLVANEGLTAQELADLRAEKAKREKELQVYRDLFGQLKKLVDAGTIEVVFRKGRMTVAMSDAILFDSGKDKLRTEGLATLEQIVPALQSVGEREFLVAGHTDDVPIRTARFKSNWELSTARALSVVRAMVEQGYPPGRLGAAGFAEHDPVAPNVSETGRAQNRRIEIVLMPNLGEIPGMKEMLQKKS